MERLTLLAGRKRRGEFVSHIAALRLCLWPLDSNTQNWTGRGSIMGQWAQRQVTQTHTLAQMYRHTDKHLSMDGETQMLLPQFSNLLPSFVPFFLSQSAVFPQWLHNAHDRSSQEWLENVLSDFMQLRKLQLLWDYKMQMFCWVQKRLYGVTHCQVLFYTGIY